MVNQTLKKCTDKVKSLIVKLDGFGHPIQLTYDNETSYKSLYGGIATMIYALAIIIYLFFEIKNVV